MPVVEVTFAGWALTLGVIVALFTFDLVHIGPVVSLVIILVAFTTGMVLSVRADRREAREADYAKKKTSPSAA